MSQTIDLILPDWPAPENVQAVTTTRSGGVSAGHYAALNLGDHVGDDPAAVAENRRLLTEAASLSSEPCWLNQVHGIAGIEARSGAAGTEADWSWSECANVVCVVMTADCLPLLMCDKQGTRVAAVHAGWRGMCAGVIEAAVASFTGVGIEPENMLVWQGPAISSTAYEVDAVVYDAFLKRTPDCATAFSSSGAGKWQFDLYEAARQILHAQNVTNVFGGDFCTLADERFYSYRQRPGCGRQASLIWLGN